MDLAEAGFPGSAPQFCVIAVTALVAAFWDLRSRRIPNLLTLPVLIAGLAYSTWLNGATGFMSGLGSAAVLSLPCLVLFLFASGGAGDVKLLGALGSWLGLEQAVAVLVGVAIAGVACGFAMAMARRRMGVLLSNLSRIVSGFGLAITTRRFAEARVLMPDEQEMQPMPFGVPVFLGICLAAAGGWLWS